MIFTIHFWGFSHYFRKPPFYPSLFNTPVPGLHPLPPASWNRYGLGMRRLHDGSTETSETCGWFLDVGIFRKKVGKTAGRMEEDTFFNRNGSPMKVKFVKMKDASSKKLLMRVKVRRGLGRRKHI